MLTMVAEYRDGCPIAIAVAVHEQSPPDPLMTIDDQRRAGYILRLQKDIAYSYEKKKEISEARSISSAVCWIIRIILRAVEGPADAVKLLC